MPLSPLFKQTEGLLEEVLRTIRQEYADPYSVLCETDRYKYVEEEKILRKQLKETVESESNSCQWRSLLGLPSPQAAKCFKDAEELRQRVREDIDSKVRTMLSGKRNPPPSPSHGQGSAINLMGARILPETDTGRPANPEPPSTIITSPLNMRCSVPEISELILYPGATVQNDSDYTSDLNEAMNSPLRMPSDQSVNSSGRRPPPPPPPLRRMTQSSNSDFSLETASDPGSGSTRRSHSVRRPAPPPPRSTRQSRIPGSPINGSFLSSGPSSPNPVVMSSISELTQQMDKLVSSLVKEGLSMQAQGRRGSRSTKTNCVEINDSNAEGVTVNNGGSKNSGAVIHKLLPPRTPQPGQ